MVLVVDFLAGEGSATLAHSELEDHLEAKGRELLRRLLQDHLDLRAHNEERIEGVTDVEGLGRGAVEAGHERTLATVFGEVIPAAVVLRPGGPPGRLARRRPPRRGGPSPSGSPVTSGDLNSYVKPLDNPTI